MQTSMTKSDMYRRAIDYLDNHSKGIKYTDIVSGDCERVPLELQPIFIKLNNDNGFTNKGDLSLHMHEYYRTHYATKNVKIDDSDVKKLNTLLSKTLSMRELTDKALGQKLLKKLESMLNAIYKNHPDDADDLFDKYKYDKVNKGGNLLVKYDDAVEHVNMLIDDLDIPDETDNLEELDDLDNELDTRANSLLGKGKWRQKLDPTYTSQLYDNVSKGNIKPIVWDSKMGLVQGNVAGAKTIFTPEEIKKYYDESNGSRKEFRDNMLKNHPEFKTKLKGNYSEHGYDPNYEVNDISQALVDIPEEDREVEFVNAPVGTGKKHDKVSGFKFKHPERIDGRLLHTIDASDDDINHDTVNFYLVARDENSEGHEKFNRFSYMGIRAQHLLKGKEVASNYIPIGGAVDAKSRKWPDNKQIISTINEKIKRVGGAENDFQTNYQNTGEKIHVDRPGAAKDWATSISKFFSEQFNLEDARKDKNYWGHYMEPLLGWSSNGRKPAYYLNMFTQPERHSISGTIGAYYDAVLSGKQEFSMSKMNNVIQDAFQKVL